MKLLDVVTAPWAILPDKLLEIQAIYATHLRGEKIDLAGVEARIGKPLKSEHQPYQVVDGVAILPIEGVLAKRMNLMSSISGGASTELIARDFKAALADPNVSAIILAIDSPGGSVDGTQQLAQLVLGARGSKPIVTYADGTMASAAYWIGAAADKAFIASDTTAVGSIGVVATHTDVSGREAAAGIKTTEIVAGAYKRIASQYGALTESGRAAMQAQVDAIYEVFVADVAAARGVSEEKVLADMADGRVFLGKAAIEAGLVDGVATLDALIAQLASGAGVAAQAKKPQPSRKGPTMELSKESIAAEHPEIAQAFRAEGAQAERERIFAVEAQMLPGHKALIDQLKADGTTTGPEAAAQVLAAERSKLAAAKANLDADAPAPLPHAAAPAAEQAAKDPRADALARAKAYQAENPGVDLASAFAAIAKQSVAV
jgi:signal peptide peptidase SppA